MEFDRKTELFVIICDWIWERKKIYKYLDSIGYNYKGCYNKSYSSEKYMLTRCYGCNGMAKFTEDDYRKGMLDNNRDAYYAVQCRCGDMFSHDAHYYDHNCVYNVHRNNMIVVGDYIRKKNQEKIVNDAKLIDEKEFIDILEYKITFVLPIPKTHAKKLENYIEDYRNETIANK